jgi:hypothetical protein
MVTSSDSSLRHGFAIISVSVESVMERMALVNVSVSIFRFILITGHDSTALYAVSRHPCEEHSEERSFAKTYSCCTT